jgi:HupE / UreJ protein
LLFLLTIVSVGAGWRYWLGVVTSFTIAHSLTLLLSALNVIRFPPGVVEPGIALSIVLMAWLNVRAMREPQAENAVAVGFSSPWKRVALVFACGLLHGFGFAATIGAMTGYTHNRIATLAGFNVGIELGQFAFVIATLSCFAVIRRFIGTTSACKLPRLASSAAAAGGLMFLTQRLGDF